MAEEEYEILPHQLLSDLKTEVEALKKKLTQPDAKANELILEIESLKDSVHELNLVFEKAMEEMKDEDAGETLKTIKEKLETVVTQNETIARGMIAISDKLEDFMKKQSVTPSVAAPVRPSFPTPSYGQQMPPIRHDMGMSSGGPGRMAPIPMAITTGDEDNLPPPPPSFDSGRKRNIGGLFK